MNPDSSFTIIVGDLYLACSTAGEIFFINVHTVKEKAHYLMDNLREEFNYDKFVELLAYYKAFRGGVNIWGSPDLTDSSRVPFGERELLNELAKYRPGLLE